MNRVYRLVCNRAPGTMVADDGAGILALTGDRCMDLADTGAIGNGIAGSGGLVKTGVDELVLTGINTYSGGTTIRGGTLSIAQDASLGNPADALTLDGGTLRITGMGLENLSRRVVLGSHGGAIDLADSVFNVLELPDGLSGPGGLQKLGAGTLYLSGANTYTGGTIIESGLLVLGYGGMTGSIAGDVVNNAFLGFDRRDHVTFAGNVSGSGVLSHQGGTLVLTGRNTYSGGTVIFQGVVQVGNGGVAGSIVEDVNNGGTLVFDRSDAYAFGGAISGQGALRQAGSGTLTLTGDSSARSGTSEVAGGIMAVDGKLGGTLMVRSGATLAGTGSIGAATVARGGILAPGNAANSFGALAVNGGLTLAHGAVLRVKIDLASTISSTVRVTGTANLAGSLHLDVNGNAAAAGSYTLLSAGQGVHGTFDSVSSNLASLTPLLVYSANSVELVLQLKQVATPGGEPAVLYGAQQASVLAGQSIGRPALMAPPKRP